MANNGQPGALTIEVDQAMYDRLVKELASVPDGVARAEVAAINRVLPAGRRIVVNKLYEILAVRRKQNIRDRTSILKASRSRISGTIRIMRRRISLANFEATDSRNKKTGTGHGVDVRIFRGGKMLNFPHAFVGIGANDNAQVFERVPGPRHRVGEKAHYKPNVGRKMAELKSIQGESLLDVFQSDPAIMEEVIAKIRADFSEALLSQIDRFLHRRKVDRPG